MLDALTESFLRSGLALPLDLNEVARDYCADGCYEPLYTGRSEFQFGYVFLLQVGVHLINFIHITSNLTK